MSVLRRSLIAFSLCASTTLAHAQPVTLRLQGSSEPGGSSATPAVSADGSTIVFRSLATNLAPAGGTLYAWDRGTRTITALAPAANGNIFDPAASSDARYVAFETSANNLAPGADSPFNDVLRLDRVTGSFIRASQGFGGSAANGGSQTASISGDGRRVVFASLASNLLASATAANRRHIFEANLDNGQIELVSGIPGGSEGDEPSSPLEANAISTDGTRIVFTTAAENLTPVFNGNVSDVLVRTRNPVTGAVSFQNVNRAGGVVGNLSSSRGSISPNGRWVVFRSGVGNLLPGGASPSGLVLRDLDSDAIQAVPLPAGFNTCPRARVADTGDIVMQCAPNAPATVLQLFSVDRGSGAIRLLSVSTSGSAANASAGASFTLSADARMIAFESAASDHIVADTNGLPDVFVRADAGVLDSLFANGFE